MVGQWAMNIKLVKVCEMHVNSHLPSEKLHCMLNFSFLVLVMFVCCSSISSSLLMVLVSVVLCQSTSAKVKRELVIMISVLRHTYEILAVMLQPEQDGLVTPGAA